MLGCALEHLATLAAQGRPNAPARFPALAVVIDGATAHCTIFTGTEPLGAARSAVHRLPETIPK